METNPTPPRGDPALVAEICIWLGFRRAEAATPEAPTIDFTVADRVAVLTAICAVAPDAVCEPER